MTECKWTPGPWVFDQENVGKSFEWCWQIRTEISGTPVYVECSDRYNRDHSNEGVAHLIAAAPELYDALESLRGCISETRGRDAYDAVDAADAALAKARGDQ